jgi:hypothetical protein
MSQPPPMPYHLFDPTLYRGRRTALTVFGVLLVIGGVIVGGLALVSLAMASIAGRSRSSRATRWPGRFSTARLP